MLFSRYDGTGCQKYRSLLPCYVMTQPYLAESYPESNGTCQADP